MVGEIASYHLLQPPSLFGNRLMPAAQQLDFDLAQLRAHPILYRLALHSKLTAPMDSTDVYESQKRKRLRCAKPDPLAVSGRKASSFDEARLFGVQFERKLLHPLPQRAEELFRIGAMLESNDKVVGITHEDHLPSRMSLPPPLGP